MTNVQGKTDVYYAFLKDCIRILSGCTQHWVMVQGFLLPLYDNIQQSG